jgi:MFS family permease
MSGAGQTLLQAVKRNLALIAAAQAFLTINVQTFVVHVPITISLLGGSAALAGLGSALMWGGRIVTTYQMGRLMDRVGRMPVIYSGMVIVALSAAAASFFYQQRFMEAFLLVIVLFGVGRGMADYGRMAAGDMLPPEKRGVGTGVILTGSMVGTLAVPPIVAAVQMLAGGENIAATYLMLIPFAAAGFAVAYAVKPDPLQIAKALRYSNPAETHQQAARKLSAIINRRLVFAYVSAAVATGVMVAFMSLGSLLLHLGHVETTVISAIVTVHVIGMYAFSIPLGKAADMVGRVPVTLAGVIVCSIGSYIMSVSKSLDIVTLGMFLVGVGWSAATVGSIALISDETQPSERGKAMGLNDTTTALTSLTAPILLSIIFQNHGNTALGLAGLAAATPTIILAITTKNKKE